METPQETKRRKKEDTNLTPDCSCPCVLRGLLQRPHHILRTFCKNQPITKYASMQSAGLVASRTRPVSGSTQGSWRPIRTRGGSWAAAGRDCIWDSKQPSLGGQRRKRQTVFSPKCINNRWTRSGRRFLELFQTKGVAWLALVGPGQARPALLRPGDGFHVEV